MEATVNFISQHSNYGLFFASILAQGYFNWRTSIRKSSKHIRSSKKPKEVSWLNENSFQVLVAICDAFLPDYLAEQVTFQSVSESMSSFGDIANVISAKDVEKHKEHFMRGALSMKVPEFTSIAFQSALSDEEKGKLALFLNLLSTAAGCLVVTGFAAPFQVNIHKLRCRIQISHLNYARICHWRSELLVY